MNDLNTLKRRAGILDEQEDSFDEQNKMIRIAKIVQDALAAKGLRVSEVGSTPKEAGFDLIYSGRSYDISIKKLKKSIRFPPS